MTQCPSRNCMHGRSLATYFVMGSGSGWTLHIHLHHGASSLISTHSRQCWPITSSTIIYLRFIIHGFSLYFYPSDFQTLRFAFSLNMLLDISKDASNHSMASISKLILSETTSSHSHGSKHASSSMHQLCIQMILKLMLISCNGFWRVSVTILFVQKTTLKSKGLSGCPLNLVHWVKVKGNASVDMCKMPYSTCCTITL